MTNIIFKKHNSDLAQQENNSVMHTDSIKCFLTVMFKVNTNLCFLLLESQAMRGLP